MCNQNRNKQSIEVYPACLVIYELPSICMSFISCGWLPLFGCTNAMDAVAHCFPFLDILFFCVKWKELKEKKKKEKDGQCGMICDVHIVHDYGSAHVGVA